MKASTKSALADMDALMATMRSRFVCEVLPAIPQGAVTVAQWANRFGISEVRAREELRKLVAAGMATQGKAYANLPTVSRTTPINFFILKQGQNGDI